jgi:hypothetical protein
MGSQPRRVPEVPIFSAPSLPPAVAPSFRPAPSPAAASSSLPVAVPRFGHAPGGAALLYAAAPGPALGRDVRADAFTQSPSRGEGWPSAWLAMPTASHHIPVNAQPGPKRGARDRESPTDWGGSSGSYDASRRMSDSSEHQEWAGSRKKRQHTGEGGRSDGDDDAMESDDGEAAVGSLGASPAGFFASDASSLRQQQQQQQLHYDHVQPQPELRFGASSLAAPPFPATAAAAAFAAAGAADAASGGANPSFAGSPSGFSGFPRSDVY